MPQEEDYLARPNRERDMSEDEYVAAIN